MPSKAAKILLYIAGAALFVLLLMIAGGIYFGQIIIARPVQPQDAAKKVLNIVNAYFVKSKDAVLAGKPVEENGLYKVGIRIKDSTQEFYLTKNGSALIFPNGLVNIAEFEKNAQERQKAETPAAVPKKERPVIELFVMSLCPYGVKAEKVITPLIDKYGDKADFKIKFIVDTKGDTIDDVRSMHGKDEVREDARQMAVMQLYPAQFGPYVEKIGESACLVSCGAVKLEDQWKQVAKDLKMDAKKIEAVAYGPESVRRFKADEADVKKYDASASPTLIINGVQSDAIYEGAQALERAVCDAFVNPPGSCNADAKVGS